MPVSLFVTWSILTDVHPMSGRPLTDLCLVANPLQLI